MEVRVSALTYSHSWKRPKPWRWSPQPFAISRPTSPFSLYCSLLSSCLAPPPCLHHAAPTQDTCTCCARCPEHSAPRHLNGSLFHTQQVFVKRHLLRDTFPIPLLETATPRAPSPSQPPTLLSSPRSIYHHLLIVRGGEAMGSKPSPQPDFVNQVLSEHSHYILFLYCQWLLSPTKP